MESMHEAQRIATEMATLLAAAGYFPCHVNVSVFDTPFGPCATFVPVVESKDLSARDVEEFPNVWQSIVADVNRRLVSLH